MKLSTQTLAVAVVGLLLGAGGVYAWSNQEVIKDKIAGPGGPNLSVQLSLALDDEVVQTWSIGYEPVSKLQSMSVGLEPLTYSSDQTWIDGGRTAALNAKVEATYKGKELRSDISTYGKIVTNGADGNDYLAEKTGTLPSNGGTGVFDFPKFISGKDKLCGGKATGRVTLWIFAEGSAKGMDNSDVFGGDNAKMTVDTKCQSGSLSVELTVFPFTSVRHDGAEVTFIPMQPVALGSA